MFRSFLLLSVLGTLFIIAFKGPDQTALQYAAEISVKARELLPHTETLSAVAVQPGELLRATGPEPDVLGAWDDLDRRMRETFGGGEVVPAAPASIAVAPSAAANPPLNATGPAPGTVAPRPVGADQELRPERVINQAPPLEVIEIRERVRLPSVAAAPGVPTNLRELERYYENAARLLAEIQ